jgi:hypothetical protein
MIRILLITTIFFVGLQGHSQDFNKTILKTTDPDWLYTNDGKSDTLFYLDMTPDTLTGTLLILMSGWHEKIEDIFLETKLPKEAFKRSIPTLIPSINTRVHSDTVCYKLINEMIIDYSKRKNNKIENVIIGGLSAGGIMSLNYAIHMVKNPHSLIPRPKSIVVVDPPVDLYNLWFIMERLSKRNCVASAKNEADYYMEYCNKYLGGTPLEVPEKYREFSPFSREMENGGNTVYLKDIPIRVYCEPDMDWWLARCEDLSDMNATDLSTMINTLRLIGNKHAEFITTTKKGYRLDGRRHPHSWSILDAEDTANWLEKMINNK